MPLRMRRSVRLGKRTKLNLSKRGVSVSTRIGRTTINSRGRTSTRIARGVSYTTSKNKPCGFVFLALLIVGAGVIAGAVAALA